MGIKYARKGRGTRRGVKRNYEGLFKDRIEQNKDTVDNQVLRARGALEEEHPETQEWRQVEVTQLCKENSQLEETSSAYVKILDAFGITRQTGCQTENVSESDDQSADSDDSDSNTESVELYESAFKNHFGDHDNIAKCNNVEAMQKRRFTLSSKDQLDVYGGALDRINTSNLLSKSAVGVFEHIINGYTDILFNGRNSERIDKLRKITAKHIARHARKTRASVLRGNEKLARLENEADEPAEHRDQGFTRPKCLILTETRNACKAWTDEILAAYGVEQIENKNRFMEEFGNDDKVKKKGFERKPADFVELFQGNNDNDYRIGIKLTRKTAKLYAPFYQSDIILASPLGMRRCIEKGGPDVQFSTDVKEEYDYLSSTEILIVDQASAMLMQNWKHVLFVIERINQMPQHVRDCDFNRVRLFYLEGWAKFVRQTIILADFLAPELNSIFAGHMLNYAGKVCYRPNYAGGIIEQIIVPVKQIKYRFSRYSSPQLAHDPDARFEHFRSTMLPQIIRLAHNNQSKDPDSNSNGKNQLGCLLFIPSYLDFVRVRNLLASSQDPLVRALSYAVVNEYSTPAEVQRARMLFQQGRAAVLVYTGRAHHFHRYSIRGVHSVFMYAVPDNPMHYREIVNFMTQNNNTVECCISAIFSTWDKLALERIVGNDRTSRMIGTRAVEIFEFVK